MGKRTIPQKGPNVYQWRQNDPTEGGQMKNSRRFHHNRKCGLFCTHLEEQKERIHFPLDPCTAPGLFGEDEQELILKRSKRNVSDKRRRRAILCSCRTIRLCLPSLVTLPVGMARTRTSRTLRRRRLTVSTRLAQMARD
jgi:hypothetical protein